MMSQCAVSSIFGVGAGLSISVYKCVYSGALCEVGAPHGQAQVRGEPSPQASPVLAPAVSHEPKPPKQSGGINYLSHT